MLAQRPSVANVSFAGSETLRGGYLCEWMPLSTGVYSVSVLIRVTNHPSTPGTRTWLAALLHVPYVFVLGFVFISRSSHLYKCISFNVSIPPQVPCSTSRDHPSIRSVTPHHRTAACCCTSDIFTFKPCILCSFTLAFALQLHSKQPSKGREVTLLAITVFQHNFTHSISGLGDSDVFGVRQFTVTDKAC